MFFRTTNTEIEKGLWPEAKLMYQDFLFDEDGKAIGKAHINEKGKTITFPSGSRTSFAYLELDKHADSWYGSEIAKIYFEEFQFRTEYQFEILRSRNRSRAKVTKGIRCTLNPDPNHFCYEWVKPFLDEEGYPIQELGGRTRYYLIIEGKLLTDWDREVLAKEYSKNPQTYTYIPATLADNKVLQEIDPEYADNLDSMGEIKRKQLLFGCWAATGDAGVYFNRTRLHKTDKIPQGSKTVRAFDLAHSIPTQSYRYPDYTACIKMSRCTEGFYYIWGDYIETFGDDETLVKGRIRRLPGERNKLMLAQAERDGKDVEFVIPQDGGGGKETFIRLAADFASHGFRVSKYKPGNQPDQKFKNFESFVAAVDNGLVYIVEHTFNGPTLEWFLSELELFDGVTKSTGKRKDEAVDICSAAFLRLSAKKVYTTPNIPKAETDTIAAPHLKEFKTQNLNDIGKVNALRH